MLQVLVESRAARGRSASWTVISVAAHSLVIGAALYLTARARADSAPPLHPESIVYSAPTTPRQTTPASIATAAPIALARPSFAVPPVVIPTFEPSSADLFSRVLSELGSATNGLQTGDPAGSSVPSGGIYTAASVDRIVMALPGNASPIYPTRLSNAGVEGDVLARFVVDTVGRVELKSIEIVQASHALFGDAVQRWLAQNRYSPALVNGRSVRQLVQQRIGFTLTR